MEKEKCSLDEEMLMWTSYRYCIGRHTYVSTLAPYMAKKYYNIIGDERKEFIANDIRSCIGDALKFGSINFTYAGSVPYEERDALSDLFEWFNVNVSEDRDVIEIDSIECYKESYKQDAPKRFFANQKKRISVVASDSDYNDLIEWHALASCFDKKRHKSARIEFNGEETWVECFEVWKRATAQKENGYFVSVPYKFERRLVSVERYLQLGSYAGYLGEEYIKEVKDC